MSDVLFKALAKPVYLRTSRRDSSFHMSKSRTMFGHQRLQCSLSFHMLSLRQTGRAGRRTIFCYANRQKLTNSTLIKTLSWCACETERPYLLSWMSRCGIIESNASRCDSFNLNMFSPTMHSAPCEIKQLLLSCWYESSSHVSVYDLTHFSSTIQT